MILKLASAILIALFLPIGRTSSLGPVVEPNRPFCSYYHSSEDGGGVYQVQIHLPGSQWIEYCNEELQFTIMAACDEPPMETLWPYSRPKTTSVDLESCGLKFLARDVALSEFSRSIDACVNLALGCVARGNEKPEHCVSCAFIRR